MGTEDTLMIMWCDVDVVDDGKIQRRMTLSPSHIRLDQHRRISGAG